MNFLRSIIQDNTIKWMQTKVANFSLNARVKTNNNGDQNQIKNINNTIRNPRYIFRNKYYENKQTKKSLKNVSQMIKSK